MKIEKEITKKAKEDCSYENAECAIYVSGFINGYKRCLKDYNIETKE